MIPFLVIFLLLLILSFGLLSLTRRHQLEVIAKRLHLSFSGYRESVTTAQSAGQLEFFTKFFHQYNNIFTFSDTIAFFRMADDTIFADDNPQTKPDHITIFTAEFKNQEMPCFKIVPDRSPFASSKYPLAEADIPKLGQNYRLHCENPDLPAHIPAEILSLFKADTALYLEVNGNALIFHEHALIQPADIPAFRLRGILLTHACELMRARTQGTNFPKVAPQTQQFVDDTLPPEVLPLLKNGSQNTSSQSRNWLLLGILLLAGVVIGGSFFALFLLRHFPH
ncbi:MAG: hypothetical protein J5601_02875 [Elusimicrobiaceae bacterium]|nr:hypothetical protein [Elusimicrobiaceae bacterium]